MLKKKMKRVLTENYSLKKWAMVVSLILLTYNVLVFLIPFRIGAVFWVGYIFTTIAILTQIVIYKVAFEKANNLRRVFLGVPIVKIGYTYLVAQLVIGVLLMLLATFITAFPVWIAVIPCILLLVSVSVSVIFADTVRNSIDGMENKQVETTMFMSGFHADLESLKARITDSSFKQKVKTLSDLVRYSDPVSRKELKDIENEMGQKFTLLRQEVINGNMNATELVEEITFLLTERNNKCKVLKRQPINFGSDN